MAVMTPLPIDPHLPQIVTRLAAAGALVLVAEPGAGKTTRVPPAMVRAGILRGEHPAIVMLQPRRVAARAAALRIAEENHWQLGEEVGYHVRFDKKLCERTRIRVLTEGILNRQLLDDPFLPGVGAVLLDEFHERSLHTDLAIALLREVKQTVRPDLLLLVMSATLEARPVADYLGACPVISVPGRTFPVTVEYHADDAVHLVERTANAVRAAIESASDSGDVLVFLPGADEIRRVARHLADVAARHDLLVLPLHGSLPAEEQTLALRPASKRKIVLATNIAETSLTIDGVRLVIDSGMHRAPAFDAQRGLDRLELARISQASADQRAGRAGRTAPGRCIRLWSAKQQHALRAFDEPEVQRVDLCSTVLQLHAWGRPDPRQFGWFAAPPDATLVSAERLLFRLGALSAEQNGQLTPLGKKLANLPVHPRLGRLLLAAAEHDCVDDAADLAALLSEKDIYAADAARAAPVQGESDMLIRLDLLARARQYKFAAHLRDQGIDPHTARQVDCLAEELGRIIHRRRNLKFLIVNLKSEISNSAACPSRDQQLRQLLLLGYPDRVCRRRGGDPAAAAMVGGAGVRISPESAVKQGELFLALNARHDARQKNQEALVRIASRIESNWLEQFFPQSMRVEKSVEMDAARQRVIGVRRVWYLDLLLRQDADVAVDADQASAALAAALAPQVAQIFAADEAASTLLARVALLQKAMPEPPWPAFDAAGLADALRDACAGKRAAADLHHGALVEAIRARLPYPLDRLLDQHAPVAMEVPSGNHVRIAYAINQPPILAARLQELFGWTETPRIAAGHVPLLLHLLAPNFRPVQITDDLRSFWSTAYFQVRKDLRVRYPKHSWPENPLTAKAECKGGRRN